jgi:hypothetical protein
MPTWNEAFGNAINSNYTDQSQSNPTVVSGSVHSVDVHNDQSNATFQQADAGSGGYHSPGFPSFADANNYNETHQSQNNPTAVIGDRIGSVDVHNSQSNETYQQADASSGGHGLHGADANNFNFTTQSQNNPTLVFGGSGGSVGHVDVHNDQSNATFQQADAGSGGHDLHGFPSFAGAGNFNFTTQVQADPTIVIGDHIGSVDVHNSQSNATEQLALAHH